MRRSNPASTNFESVRYTVARLTCFFAFFRFSISCSASKWECRAKTCSSSSRCCSVNRCGFGRLARYSRNLSSGVCDTATAGSDTLSLRAQNTIIAACRQRLVKTRRKPALNGRAFFASSLQFTGTRSLFDSPQESFLSEKPLFLGVVGTFGNLLPDASDQFVPDAVGAFFFRDVPRGSRSDFDLSGRLRHPGHSVECGRRHRRGGFDNGNSPTAPISR